jgi:hypothetical protein
MARKRNFSPVTMYNKEMKSKIQPDSETIARLEKQAAFLSMVYEAEFAKDPTSHATESSRSNMIAVRDTINQMYEGHPICWHRSLA